jgi:hypothetical protein
MRIAKPCLDCGCVTGGNSYCDTCRNKRDNEKNLAKGRRGPGASRQVLALRRKVLARDGYRCVVTGCPETYRLEVHKIGGGFHGGTIDSYVTLCTRHHREVEARSAAEKRAEQRPLVWIRPLTTNSQPSAERGLGHDTDRCVTFVAKSPRVGVWNKIRFRLPVRPGDSPRHGIVVGAAGWSRAHSTCSVGRARRRAVTGQLSGHSSRSGSSSSGSSGRYSGSSSVTTRAAITGRGNSQVRSDRLGRANLTHRERRCISRLRAAQPLGACELYTSA